MGRAQPAAVVSLLASWVAQLGSGAVEHEEEQVSRRALCSVNLRVVQCRWSRAVFCLSAFLPRLSRQNLTIKRHNDEAHAHKRGTACRLGLLQLLALGRALQHLAQAHTVRQITTLVQR